MNLQVDKQSAVPYYYQVKEAVKALVASGELKPGDMLPSELNLSVQLDISRLVVHRAFRELVTEGLLIRKRAVGTFVSPTIKRSYMVVGPLLSMTENLTSEGLDPSNKILVQELIPPDEEIRSALQLPEGARVIHLRNLRLVDQLPFAIEDMHFPHERFPALVTMNLNNRSIYAILEKLYDAHPQEALDLISAGAATSEEAHLLGIHKGAPVMRMKRTAVDRHGSPIEQSTVVFHADRYQFVARVQRGGL
jgi:GntR family transcriptional regulator